jgi:hypothetical protein
MSRVKPPPGRLKLPRPFPCGSLGLSLDRCAFAPDWGGFVRRAIRPRWSRPETRTEGDPIMTPNYETPSAASRLATLLDDLSAGCDADFDAAHDDIEREFAELRLALAE